MIALTQQVDMSAKGTLFGIGMGPGDPELITLKALSRLRSAAVVAYPHPAGGESFVRRIAAPHLPGGQVELPIAIPMGAPAAAAYDAAAGSLRAHLDAGRKVALLCEGDPLFYGTFMYVFDRLAPFYPIEIVPGVTSVSAAAARCGMPLAARTDTLTVLPATLPEAVLRQRLGTCDAAAIMKAGRHLAPIRAALLHHDLLDRAWLVEYATLDAERIRPFADVDDDATPYFSLVLVHRRGKASA